MNHASTPLSMTSSIIELKPDKMPDYSAFEKEITEFEAGITPKEDDNLSRLGPQEFRSLRVDRLARR
mgnify:CR=1 FL=1